jgi:3',5'-cyclic AMP phosphodiesterase CpdA
MDAAIPIPLPDEQTAATGSSSTPSPPLPPDEIRILHISDVHVGRGFDETRWNDLLSLKETLRPHLVVVTGDLVNSPWRRTLKRAKDLLDQLCERGGKSEKGEKSRSIVVPGNHDTRLLGIIPVFTVQWGLASICVIAGALWFLALRKMLRNPGGVSSTEELAGIIALVAGVLLALGALFLGRFEKYFGPLEPITRIDELGLNVLSFDSATFRAPWAEGWVLPQQFVRARNELEADTSSYFRLALLHHHALPIPYEHEAEPMMVLRNAGMFLKQISNRKIPLVLHGHRHRHNFSRITIDAAGDNPYEVAVLSAGSSSAGSDAKRLGHNFNFIVLNRWGNAQITPYLSHDQSPFAPNEDRPSFWALTVEAATRGNFAANVRTQQCKCDKMTVTFDINADGDAHRTVEYRGFETQTDRDLMPGAITVGTLTGQVERIQVGNNRDLPVGFSASLEDSKDSKRTPRSWEGSIRFSRALTERDGAINFCWESDLINAFAMSTQQFHRMYPKDPAGAKESTFFMLKHVPVRELKLVVNLPTGFKIGGTPRLAVHRANKTPEPELRTEYDRDLSYNPAENTITATIAYPPLGLSYEVEWPLSDFAPPTAHSTQSAKGTLLNAVTKMLKYANPDGKRSPLNAVFDDIREEAASTFGLGDDDASQLELSIMAYDNDEEVLRLVAASVKKSDERWALKLGYGDGIAGRAYKMNKGRIFVKALAKERGTPFYYSPFGGQSISDEGTEVTEEVIVSLPLFLGTNRETILGVLNLSSKDPGSKLVDLSENTIEENTKVFVEAVTHACLEVLDDLD